MKKLKLALTLCLGALRLLSSCGDTNVQPSADPAPASPGSSAAPDETAAPAAAPEPEPEEEEPRIRQLTVEELDELTENLDYNENGFFVCSYYRPEEIDWSEVFYNGAGIALDVTEELKADYERTN
ncbi:MAG: hypothetical protein IKR21_06050, partial [Oscillospiraceae bacterium]|nr:hypothetical protein [Oscillospiraceae bacterium]